MNKSKIIQLLILLIFILVLIAISVDVDTINQDYNRLINQSTSYLDIFKTNNPNLINPVGIFGVITSYWFNGIFGKLFTYVLLFCGFSWIFLLLINKNTKSSRLIILKFLFFSIFLIILISFRYKYLNFNYLFDFLKNQVLVRFLGVTGTVILSSGFCLIIFLDLINFNIFKNLFFYIKKLSNTIVAILRKKTKRKTKPKKRKYKTRNSATPQQSSNPDYNINVSRETSPRAPTKSSNSFTESSDYTKPDIDKFLSSEPEINIDSKSLKKEISSVSKILLKKLSEFNIEADVKNVNIGPIITQYELKPAPGIKVSKFSSLADDLALAIKAKSIRVQAPIPGRGLIGIEVPNKNMKIIYLKDILESTEMLNKTGKLIIALGKDISGQPMVADLTKMPHLLIAGATGSGKSVCVNTIINSILFRTKPEEVRLVLVDPKRIELSGYEDIPHLIQEVVTDSDDALKALNWGVSEMERRYELLQKYKVRNITGYNRKIKKLKKNNDDLEDDFMPFIVIIVDEFADLIMTAGRDVEMPITRLAQMARAIGIHLILATQRPSTKVITGIIKANFPARIAFRVSSKTDSRVILDSNGAERLLGRGDMLFLPPGKANPVRIHGAFVNDPEIENLVEYLKTQPKPEQDIKILSDEESPLKDFEYDDELFPQAAHYIVSSETASVSMLQRHFKIGYARAGRLVDMLEKAGIVGPHVGSKPREVLVSEEDLDDFNI